jgi:hypothetical protein
MADSSQHALPGIGLSARFCTRTDRASRRSYMFRAMFWPLAGGFIAFILVAILLGWILDPSRRGDADGHGPGH